MDDAEMQGVFLLIVCIDLSNQSYLEIPCCEKKSSHFFLSLLPPCHLFLISGMILNPLVLRCASLGVQAEHNWYQERLYESNHLGETFKLLYLVI